MKYEEHRHLPKICRLCSSLQVVNENHDYNAFAYQAGQFEGKTVLRLTSLI